MKDSSLRSDAAAHPSPAATQVVTPMMVKAAWVEARKWWPRKFVEGSKGFFVKETCIRVDEPQPGFREAIEAALRAA